MEQPLCRRGEEAEQTPHQKIAQKESADEADWRCALGMGTTYSEEGKQHRRGTRYQHPDYHDGPHCERQCKLGCAPSTHWHQPHVGGTATLTGHGLHGIGRDCEVKPG